MKIDLDKEAIRPLIQQTVAETLAQLDDERSKLGDQLAFTEPHAAALLDIAPHVLRDLRLQGLVEASKLGKRIVYTRADLVELLLRLRWSLT